MFGCSIFLRPERSASLVVYELERFSYCLAMLCIIAAYAIMRCVSVRVSVCPSVRHVCVFCQNELHILFTPSGSHTILVFP